MPAKSSEKNTASKILIIAEKPSVAADLVKTLPGKFKKERTHYEGKDTIVSFAVGHLVTIGDPKDMDESLKAWNLSNLPIIPENFLLKAIPGTRSQLNALKKLIRRKDVDSIINACDAGREGELIFRYIMDLAASRQTAAKKFRRLWLQAMTPEDIREGFENLRNDEDMKSLEAAARSRSEADWLVGINGSRGLTSYNSQGGGFYLTPCGRVQTPTLSMMVWREEARKAFVSTDYWIVEADFTSGDSNWRGKWFDPDYRKNAENPHGAADRIWNKDRATQVHLSCTGKTGNVSEESKPSLQKCPPLYDLTSLQREANSRFGFPAKMTLNLAQALYEKYKLLTYPRTDSKALPASYVDVAKKTLKSQKNWKFGKYAGEALQKSYVKPDKRIFNNAKISDHHAIIPTPLVPGTLPEAETKIYQMVVQRFIAVFFPAAKFLNTQRITVVEGESFRTEGKILEIAGWKAIYGGSSDKDKLLDPLSGSSVHCAEVEVFADETKAPARYTESTLLSAMESAGKKLEDDDLREALKERGLGTPATRAAVIEKLLSDKYIVREGRELIPTSKAFDLLKLLSAMKIEELTSPELTGEWEHKLNLIERGELTREQFMKEIETLARNVVKKIKGFDENATRKEASFSPIKGQKWFETLSRYEAEDGKSSVRKFLGGRQMEDSEVAELLEKGTLGPLKGFRSKKGDPFTAVIRMGEKGRVEFVFEDDTSGVDGKPFVIEKETPIGISPVDNSPVYETLTSFISKSSLDKEKTGLRISKTILGKEIPREDVQRMLSGEKTSLLQGFRSKKGRLFDAYLSLAKTGKISFDFPPRAPRRKKTVIKKKDGED